MAPAARRRKRIMESDDEDDDVSFSENSLTRFVGVSPQKTKVESVSPVKRTTRATSKKPPPSPLSSPESTKPPAPKKPKTKDKSRSGDLISLFSRQAQRPPSLLPKPTTTLVERPRNPPPNEEAAIESISDIDQLIDSISDIDDIDDFEAETTAPTSIVGRKASKRLKTSNDSSSSHKFFSGSTASSTQSSITSLTTPVPRAGSIFLRPATSSGACSGSSKKENVDDDLRPWPERFAPLDLDELAVHKKKVADVRRWLTDTLTGLTRQRMLLLKGHAGTGKTTTVRLLARDIGFQILEWKNPVGGLFGNMQSASAQFEAFLGVGGTFGSLETDETEAMEAPVGEAFSADDKSKRIILIEEFPNTYTRSSSTLSSFRNTVLGFLAANTPSLGAFAEGRVKEPIVPIVMVISETLLTTTSASADSFTAHRLLGPDILRHPGAATIEFNAIAPSILTKALELVVRKEARKSGRKRTPGPQVLKKLGEIGDIRNAVSSLEFLCLKGDIDGHWGARVQLTKPKKALRDISMTEAEKDTLDQVSQREASLGIFHAVGKIVYNKRDETRLSNNPAETLPPFLARHSRPRRSQVNVDTLIDEIGTDTSTFVSALHENYPLSCEPPITSKDAPTAADYINGCIDSLSDADMLFPSWDVFFGGRGAFSGSMNRDTGSYVLRQDEMAFQVAVRGLLHSLPVPVKRQQHPGRGTGGDAFKMFYPTSIKLWRTREEIEGMLDMWSSKLLRGEQVAPKKELTAGANLFRRTASPKIPGVSPQPSTTEPLAPLLSLGSAARKELTLERLPAMANILRARRSRHGPSAASLIRLKDIEKVVSFHGIGAQSEDAEEEEGEEVGGGGGGGGTEQWATDRPTEEAVRRRRTGIWQVGRRGEEMVTGVRGLVFGDEDAAEEEIEDDVED